MWGGGPVVWAVCMVFFQCALLGGYAYAHLVATRLAPRRQALWHALPLIMGATFLPLSLGLDPLGLDPAAPIMGLFGILLKRLGLPFLILAATAPLLQSWYHRAGQANPYPLYAAGNVGSLLALLAYPIVIEPYLTLTEQRIGWSAGYLLFAVLLLVFCAPWRTVPRTITESREDASPASHPPSSESPRRWLLLSLFPSLLLIGVTNHLTTDIAAAPLLWTMPLALYLFSFVLAFSRDACRLHAAAGRVTPLLLIPLVIWLGGGVRAQGMIWIPLLLHLASFFAIVTMCHAALAARRPAPHRLTAYYLWIATGGALGGILAALVAPILFDRLLEYPLSLIIAAFLIPRRTTGPDRGINRLLDLLLPLAAVGLFLGLDRLYHFLPPSWNSTRPFVVLGLPAIFCFFFISRPVRFGLGMALLLGIGLLYQSLGTETLLRIRTPFGAGHVFAEQAGAFHTLSHGGTIHGRQYSNPEIRQIPLTYYHPTGPIGEIFSRFAERDSTSSVAVVGLGAGSMAFYGSPDRRIDFYEIDPAMERIARDTRCFTFLADAPGEIEVILGDARLSLARVSDRRYGLIVLDAFSADAIPTHLLTREAMALYLERLDDDGLLAFHLSNRYLNLHPVLYNLAADAGLQALLQHDAAFARLDLFPGKLSSTWVVVARREELLAPFAASPRWQKLPEPADRRPWTDDYSNIIAIFRWK
jgi:hypothetical protein